MASRATTKDGVSIAYDDRGVGEPVFVCLPGWCSDRFQFSPIVDHLSSRGRTIVLDWRGHGESGTLDNDYGHDEMTEDVLAVIDAAGVERMIPVAAAHAGWAALDLCRRLDNRVAGLVFISWMVMGAPPPFIAGLRRMQQPDGWAEVRDQLFQMWRGEGSNPGVEQQIARMNSYGADTWMRAGREIESATSVTARRSRFWHPLIRPYRPCTCTHSRRIPRCCRVRRPLRQNIPGSRFTG
jgi:pimeloyl-ACP methyl ester carboxylesterase